MSDDIKVHFEPYGDDWSACGEYTPHRLHTTRQRNQTTCMRCRARFINPTDSEYVLELLAQSSSSALAAHDAEVAAKALDDVRDYLRKLGDYGAAAVCALRAQALRDGQEAK